MSVQIRRLTDDDRDALDAFLRTDVDATLFLRSNLRDAGMDVAGHRLSMRCFGAFGDSHLAGVGGQVGSGNVLLYAPQHADEIVRRIARDSEHPVAGLIGPRAQVISARTALSLEDHPTTMDSNEIRYGLDLSALRIPEALRNGGWASRRAQNCDVEQLARWRLAYNEETLHGATGPDALDATIAKTRAQLDDGRSWVLLDGGRLVAMSRFNAALPDIVQIGGVYTPPAWRNRGYGRAVVAGSLVTAREEGVLRSVLFTDTDNLPAQRAYEALGYERVGDYSIVVFS